MTLTIAERREYEVERRKIDSIVDSDSELPNQVFRPTPVAYRFLELDQLWSTDFFSAAQRITGALGGARVTLAVLRPDPDLYYFANFRRFPIVHFDLADEPEGILATLHADPGNSPADAIAHNSDALVVYPDNLRWVLFGDRNLELAVIAAMDGAALDAVMTAGAAWRTCSAREAITGILSPLYRGAVPEKIQVALLENYGREAADSLTGP